MEGCGTRQRGFAGIAGEPYRVLFPMGAVIGLAGVAHWLFYALGWIPVYSGVLHSAVLLEAFMGCFIAGFLGTALPRFTASFPCRIWEFLLLTGLIVLCAFFHLSGHEPAGRAAFGAWVFVLAVFAFRRASSRKKTVSGRPIVPPVELIWVPIAILHAWIGYGLYAAALGGGLSYRWLDAGRRLSDQGFLLCIVLGVGGFLGSRLMGTFRLRPGPPEAQVLARRVLFHLFCAAAVFVSFLLEGFGRLQTAFLVRAAAVTACTVYTGGLALKPVGREAYVWGVWISFWLIAAGHWGAAVMPLYRLEWMHLVFLGGYTLMTFSVAVMVMLSHAGEGSRLKGRLPLLTAVYAAVLLSLAVRLAAPFFPARYFAFLGAASAVWSAAVLFWLILVLPRAFRFADEGELERAHEEAKRKILQQKSRDCCGHGHTACVPEKEEA